MIHLLKKAQNTFQKQIECLNFLKRQNVLHVVFWGDFFKITSFYLLIFKIKEKVTAQETALSFAFYNSEFWKKSSNPPNKCNTHGLLAEFIPSISRQYACAPACARTHTHTHFWIIKSFGRLSRSVPRHVFGVLPNYVLLFVAFKYGLDRRTSMYCLASSDNGLVWI